MLWFNGLPGFHEIMQFKKGKEMSLKHAWGTKEKAMIWPVFLTVCYFCIVFLVFPPIYAMNDDVMIESILSGSYLRPYPYTYYFSAELGWVISGLYFLLPWIPWLGCFFALCNAVCVFSFAQLAFSRTDVKPMHQFLFAGLSFVGISALCFQSFV